MGGRAQGMLIFDDAKTDNVSGHLRVPDVHEDPHASDGGNHTYVKNIIY